MICCLVLVSEQDLLIHWHTLPAPLERLGSPPSALVAFVVFFGFLVAFCGLFWFGASLFGTAMTPDCVLVRTPLSTPQGGTLNMHRYNSFFSTTMCDDLARATEARDGKKNNCEKAILWQVYRNGRVVSDQGVATFQLAPYVTNIVKIEDPTTGTLPWRFNTVAD